MRVLHIVRALDVGGLENVVVDLVNGLQGSSIECFLGCLLEEGQWRERANVNGIWTGSLGHRCRLAVLLDLCRYVKRQKIDLIHSHNPQPHSFGVAASVLTCIPLIHTKHGRNYPDDRRWVWKSRQMSRFTKKIAAVSEDVARVAVEVEQVPREKVVVIRNGIDVGKRQEAGGKSEEETTQQMRAERHIPKDAFVVGSVGRLAPERNGIDVGKRQEAGGKSEEETTQQLRAERHIPKDAFVVGSVGRLAPEKNYELLIRAFARVKVSGFRFQVSGGEGIPRDHANAELGTRNAEGNPISDIRYPISNAERIPDTRHSTLDTGKIPTLPHSHTPTQSLPTPDTRNLTPALEDEDEDEGRFEHTHTQAVSPILPYSDTPILLLVGDGPEREKLEKLVRDLGLDEVVAMPGMQKDVRPWLDCMDVFCLTSITEGTSITLLEAGACGIPAVVTDVGGNREVVEDGETGIVVPSGDEEGIAAAIAKLEGDEALRCRMGEAAGERVAERYSVEQMVEQYAALYEQILSR